MQQPPELRLNRWARLCRDVRDLPLRQAGRLVAEKASKGWRGRKAEQSARAQIATVQNDPGALLPGGLAFSEYVKIKFASLEGFPVPRERAGQVCPVIEREFPVWRQRCIEQASLILENHVSLLGHDIKLDDPPAWWRDHLNGADWPQTRPGARRDLRMPQGADMKFVWELSRFHQAVTLGRAFALTRDERFAGKFFSLFSNWAATNPPYVGPNWGCTMEVAIRAVNLLWTAGLLASSAESTAAARELLVKSLLVHGIFIRNNLEYTQRVINHSIERVNGNHYLANLAGLLHVSCAFKECCYSTEWEAFATNELFAEIRSQVDDEGVHWEYSPGYHRLVLEMILQCLILLERHGKVIPDDIRERTVKMLEFTRHYRKPSGDAPLVRDIDNGRFCILGDEQLITHDHLLAVGAIYLDMPGLYPGELHEDCLWHLGPSAYEWHRNRSEPSATSAVQKKGVATNASALATVGVKSSTRERWAEMLGSRLYRNSGFALMRQASHYLLAICCPKGAAGFCGHTHNDFLSFGLEAYGRTFLTDCGSYVYTQSPEWRNRFRSTSSHNTLMVDGQEQNRFNSSDLFEIGSLVRPEVQKWDSNDKFDLLDAAYTLALPGGVVVTHQRRFVFQKDEGVWLVRDRVTGDGLHNVETRFHFDEGIELRAVDDRVHCASRAGGPSLFLFTPGPSPPASHIEAGWVSKNYESKKQTQVLRFAQSAHLPFQQWYTLLPVHGSVPAQTIPITALEELCTVWEKI